MKFMNSGSPLYSAATLLLAFAGTSSALETRIDTATQQIQHSDLTRSIQQPTLEVVPSLYKGEEKDLGPQYVVHDDQPKQEWIEAAADVQFGSTSNVSLVESNRVESSIMISTAQVALTPPPWEIGNGLLSLKAGYRHQKFNYGLATSNQGNLKDLDFDVSTLFTQARFQHSENWGTTFGIEYSRLLSAGSPADYEEFYSEITPSITLDRRFKIDEKSSLMAALGTSWHQANTGSNDRADATFTLAYLRELIPRLYAQPFYRAQAVRYRLGNRSDLIQTAGVTFSYSITANVSARAYVNFECRESTTSADYRKLDSGLGASLYFRF